MQCLEQHVRRVNYQVVIWKCAKESQADIPPPTEGHDLIENEGVLEPLWTARDILPRELTDVLEDAQACESSSDEDNIK